MLDFLFMDKNYCYLCKEEYQLNHNLCRKCLEKLDEDNRIIRIDNTDVHIIYFYNEYFKKLLALYKFDRNTSLAHVFSSFVYNYIKDKDLASFDYLIYTPSSKSSINVRGFDHMKMICDLFIDKTSMTYLSEFKKIKKTKAQHTLDRDERKINLKGAFSLTKDLSNKKVLIIDDLITTGSTVREIIKVVKDKNPQTIRVLALASEKKS